MDNKPRATLEQKIEVLDWYYNNGTKSQLYTVKYFQNLGLFGITKSSFNRWLKDEMQLRQNFQNLNINNRKLYKVAPVYKHLLVDKCLEFWYEQNIWYNRQITERELVYQYKVFAKLIGVGGETPSVEDGDDKALTKSNGWCYHFKQKHKDRKLLLMDFVNMKLSFQGESTSLNQERNRIKNLLQTVDPADVYQYDEFFINDGLQSKNSTFKFCIGMLLNSNGSNFHTPLIVNNSHDVKGPGYYQSSLGRITNDIFLDWLEKLNKSLNRKIYILLDCIMEHVVDYKKFRNLEFIWLNPGLQTNLSYLGYGRIQHVEYQPFYLGIGQIFKMLFKIKIWQIYSQNLEIRITSQQIYQIVQWCLSRICGEFKNNVISCFENSGLLPWFNDESSYGKSMIDKNLINEFMKFWIKFGGDESIKPTSQQLSNILFAQDEQLINKFYTDVEIVAIVKLRSKDNEIRPYQNSNISVDPMELDKLNRVINTDMRQFFNKYGMVGSKFEKSCLKFNEFLNDFLQDFESL